MSFEKKYWELFEAAIPKQLQMYSISVLKTRGYRDELNRIDGKLLIRDSYKIPGVCLT